MQKIAICESNPEDSAALQNMLDDYEKESRLNFTVRTFCDAESLVVSITCDDYKPDILLTGIFLSGMSGIEAVRKLRELGFYSSVIFTTSSPDYALTAYELDAAQYLVKPVNYARLTSAIDRIVGARNGCIVVKQRRAIRKIICNDILYCETKGKYQVIHMQTEDISVRMTARSMRKLVPPPPL